MVARASEGVGLKIGESKSQPRREGMGREGRPSICLALCLDATAVDKGRESVKARESGKGETENRVGSNFI